MNKKEARQLAVCALGELAEQLDRGLSDRLRQYMRVMRRFRAYSLGNTLLIMMQRPNATHVAGYRTWLALGRQVKRGEHGILILAPVARRQRGDNDKDPQERERDAQDRTLLTDASVTGFRSAYVFDIAQTDGRDLPEFAQASGNPQVHLARLKQLVESEGIALAYHTSLDGADGCSSPGQILIRSGMMPAEEFSVLAHELAHHRMHLQAHDTTNHAVLETEAEAVAFVVCDAVGVDSRRSSTDYIHLHQGDKQLLLKSLNRIRRCALEIVDAIDGRVPPAEEPVLAPSRPCVAQAGPLIATRFDMLRKEWPMDSQKRQKTIMKIRRHIGFTLASGLGVPDGIVDEVLRAAAKGCDAEELRPVAERLFREAIASRRALEMSWPAVTDCDRLEAAFAELEKGGILCRQDFACCGKCGCADMAVLIRQEQERGREVIGYTFYHVQDTERVMEDGLLYLSYGSVLPCEEAYVAVGHKVASALRAQGLKVEWDGTLQRRIAIKLDWKHRLGPSFATGS